MISGSSSIHSNSSNKAQQQIFKTQARKSSLQPNNTKTSTGKAGKETDARKQ